MTPRTKNLFDPASPEPYRLSRSKLELFLECARCFTLDRRLGISRPEGPPFTLNAAVDTLLKKEFDIHRAEGRRHLLMETYGIDALPFQHPDLSVWRQNFKGIEVLHEGTNFLFFGAVDDVWINPGGELIVVDYKATSTDKTISLDDEWKEAYKRQMEMYQWLLRHRGFPVSATGYFVFVNAKKDRAAFDAKLEFGVMLLPYKGKDDWVEDALTEARMCLECETLPPSKENCAWCRYRKEAREIEN